MDMRLGLLAAVVAAAGCAEAQPPSVAYQGKQLQSRRPDTAVEFYRDKQPPKAWQEMGIVRVKCPLAMTSTRSLLGEDIEATGGCSLSQVIKLMRKTAGDVGADGVCSLETSTGSNGAIVGATGTVFRYRTDAPAAATAGSEPAPNQARGGGRRSAPMPGDEDGTKAGSSDAAAKASVEERLNELKRLHESGLVTDDEYSSRRAEILKDL